MPSEMLPSEEQPRRSPSKDHYFLKLWIIVSLLWTGATLLRAHRVWVPIEGWRAILLGPWLWLELALPPLMFGVVMLGVHQLSIKQRNFRDSMPRCRRRF